MRILNISPVFPPLWNFGGSVTTSFEVARGLIRAGHDVFALTTDARRHSNGQVPLSRNTVCKGVPVRYCQMWGPAPPFWSPELRRQVRLLAARQDIALIRSCWTYVGVAASRECRRARLPYLAYPEGSLDPWTLRYGWRKKRIWWSLGERAYFANAAALVALSQAERAQLHRLGITGRVEVIPNGIHLADLEDSADRAELEATWDRLKGRRWLIFLGRLHPKKGLSLLISAFSQISARFPDHLLVIAGPDEEGYAERVQKMAEDAGISRQALLAGPVSGPSKLGLLKEADAFVLTSFSEGQPLAAIEALGCGTPVLLTEPCNLPEVAEAGAGLVVTPSLQEVAKSLREILQQDNLRQEMGRRAKALVRSRFTWDIVVRQTAALCRDVVNSA